MAGEFMTRIIQRAQWRRLETMRRHSIRAELREGAPRIRDGIGRVFQAARRCAVQQSFGVGMTRRGKDTLRRAALVVIGMSVAKVFLVDMPGLSGLTRVSSLMALGLALAGLAWLNRWAAEQSEDAD